MNIRLHGKTLSPTKFVKYLGIYLDEYLSGDKQCSELIKKLNRFMSIKEILKCFEKIYKIYKVFSFLIIVYNVLRHIIPISQARDPFKWLNCEA